MSQPNQSELAAVRSQIIALEQQLVAARHAYAQLEQSISQSQHQPQPNPMASQVETAMHFVAMFQNSTRPTVVVSDDLVEWYQRDPSPKELSALSAACDLLERFFDSGGAGASLTQEKETR